MDRLLGNRAKMLGERDCNDEPLTEGNNDDDDVYDKDGNITNNNNKYAVGIDGVNEPLDEGDDEYDTLSAAPARGCLESQRPSMPSC
jgi:hypothetical protein